MASGAESSKSIGLLSNPFFNARDQFPPDAAILIRLRHGEIR